jgi:hypothetical protein
METKVNQEHVTNAISKLRRHQLCITSIINYGVYIAWNKKN